MNGHFLLTLLDRQRLTPHVMHYTFARRMDPPWTFQPGQFIQLHFPDLNGNPIRRSYSIANRHDPIATPTTEIELVVRHIPGGKGSAFLDALPIGCQVDASGPHGHFFLQEGDRNLRYLLVATGTGIAVFRSMLLTLERWLGDPQHRSVLLVGVRTPDDLLFAEEFAALARDCPRFHFLPCFSQVMPDEDRYAARFGHVQGQLAELHPDPETDIAYLCGNPGMVDACVLALRTAGLRMARIRREKFLPND